MICWDWRSRIGPVCPALDAKGAVLRAEAQFDPTHCALRHVWPCPKAARGTPSPRDARGSAVGFSSCPWEVLLKPEPYEVPKVILGLLWLESHPQPVCPADPVLSMWLVLRAITNAVRRMPLVLNMPSVLFHLILQPPRVITVIMSSCHGRNIVTELQNLLKVQRSTGLTPETS